MYSNEGLQMLDKYEIEWCNSILSQINSINEDYYVIKFFHKLRKINTELKSYNSLEIANSTELFNKFTDLTKLRNKLTYIIGQLTMRDE